MGGSPRAYWTWPLAWPSPSGPLAALTALTALGLSRAPVHEPVRAWHRQYLMTVTQRDAMNSCPFLDRELVLGSTDLKTGDVGRSEHGWDARSYPLPQAPFPLLRVHVTEKIRGTCT